MKVHQVFVTLCAIFSLASATAEFDRAFSSLRKRALPSLTTSTTASSTKNSSLPAITSSTAANSTSLSSSNSTILASNAKSSYSPTFTPQVPNSSGNHYIFRTKYHDGTVFVAVGATIGAVVLAFGLTWLVLAAKAWSSARREHRMHSLQSRYQSDPFLFHSGDADSDYSDGSDSSDISERVLKTRATTRPSIYSLGSHSTLDLLQRYAQEGPLISEANKESMFISPTAVIKNTANNRSALSQSTPTSGTFNTTPVQGADVVNFSGSAYHPSRTAGVQTYETGTARPPSVHLEKMFDEDR
ncbi:LAQU0S03e09076g1_1 [Lachancea quebecensis]|uniref:LAQU0S03e09076g1_1 n=1 Tax=Lachancea quebecensis TaxID=1654605 RepID=A0A0P1KPL0_9SACH|nr:LAQU0S03e09076g1_1 [Lachancea quebecensis]